MINTTNGKRFHTILLVAVVSLLVIIFALTAAILGVINNQKKDTAANVIIRTTTVSSETASLLETINATQLMFHLGQLQAIADSNDRTRALGTTGFEATIDYIEAQLRLATNFQIFRQKFSVGVSVKRDPFFTSIINGIAKNYTYEKDFSEAFASPNANLLTPVRLTLIPNSGCTDDDWKNATPHPAMNSVALVIDDQNCSLADKSILAQEYNPSGLLAYDSDSNATTLPFVYVDQDITYPVMILSYQVGLELVEAMENSLSNNVSVRVFRTRGNTVSIPTPTENVCADTLTGDKTQTIVVGSHSDSIANGSGINDNGSGAMATLVLAMNLAKLFQTSSYQKYPYRIRFCWWAGEELNLKGSYYHVEEAQNATVEGNRLRDYVMTLNLDMIASPNYYFGIYEPDSLGNAVSTTVRDGSRKISQVFRNWFDKTEIPWDNSSLGILSDHVPFLVAGVVSGGLFSGADGIKTLEQRNRYDRLLGHGYGGIFGAKYDPCYHLACDTIENISPFAYEMMTKAAAHVLETLARTSDLRSWLYGSVTTDKTE